MIKSIVIVGGGTAGWISAGIIAARHRADNNQSIEVTLVESPDIPTIGVGEGTWPSMVNTIKTMGISEREFVRECDVSFKQGIKFERWISGRNDDVYYHPFSYPHRSQQGGLIARWLRNSNSKSYAESITTQCYLDELSLAPKQLNSPEFNALENYAYHLDAAKFSTFLKKHCTRKLKVRHIVDNVQGVNTNEQGNITSLKTQQNNEIEGDLFIDCSGISSILLRQHFGIPFKSCKDTLFVDRALAVQVPYQKPSSPIASMTRSVAQQAGWIWDIGLPSRRGIGHVFSSNHISVENAAKQLEDYLRPNVNNINDFQFREIRFEPGHAQKFWVKNCIAVGLSAGFVEPLEASALGMIELSARMIAEHLPVSHSSMDVVAENFNQIFLQRWQLIIDFLKLHYCLSKRNDSEFWIDNRKSQSMSDTLKNLLRLWENQPPLDNGFMNPYDMFPVASYQYILYGMNFLTQPSHLNSSKFETQEAIKNLQIMASRTEKLAALVPTNRELIKSMTAR
ncbi:tryptophan halogenase family protein [Aliikangiella coralliicola]|uniref:Tryptophan 7-halogenase n=1 Tax=Aliikangiella coralliicola TaxID=2592383 RepID=A0A545UIC8_9GAMM|nr:tryptophan halogenase family protein [Aliikangiella coralliicola]TQV89217.1 tryptophan 7-halogenase [Aliikangiella coralliicola]